MRVLLAADLHYSLPQLDWVVAVAPEFDLVVLAGDHLDLASAVPLEAQSVVVLRYLSMLHDLTHVAVSSGNHDLTGPDARGEQSALWLEDARAAGVPTDGDSLLIGDTLVTICPWWDGPEGRTDTAALLAADAARRPARWIWVYHWPPMDSPTCWTGRRHYGDADLVGWIDEFSPDVVLAGHVHEPPFKPDGAWADRIGDTWVFNAGRQTGPIPTRVEIDFAEGRATWLSLMGIEEIGLDATVTPAAHAVLSTNDPAQYSGSGSRADPGRAGGPCRCASWPSTSDTIARPGLSPYWCFRSARYVVTNARRSASPAATRVRIAGSLVRNPSPSSARAQAAGLGGLDGRRVRRAQQHRDLPDECAGAVDGRHLDLALEHTQRARDEHPGSAAGTTFVDNGVALGEFDLGKVR